MSLRKSHVPKFGTWEDADNMQFSGDFETARKERAAAVGINPNDQQENPEAFMPGRVEHGSGGTHANSDKLEPADKCPSEELKKDKSNPDYSLQQQNSRRRRSDRKKNRTEINGGSATPSPGPDPRRSASYTSDDKDTSYRTASVPKFGAWDDMDPSEGYTVIFEKVKEEKQNPTTNFTAASATPKPSKPMNHQIKRTRSKIFCCLK